MILFISNGSYYLFAHKQFQQKLFLYHSIFFFSQPISKALSFHAPESYGNDTDVFDPIQADIWSYGATWFYLITQTYPFRLNDPNLDLLIRNSVAAITEYSDSGNSFF